MARLKEALLVLAFVAVTMGIAALATVASKPPEERTGALIFYAVFGLFLFVMIEFKQAAQFYEKVMFGYMRFAGGALLMIAVPMGFRMFAGAAVGRWPLWVQIGCLSAWGVLLAGALAAIGTRQMRHWILSQVARVNVGLPAAYSVSVLMLASLFFSSVCFILVQQQQLALEPGSSREVSLSSLSDFFLWHFADAVPLLSVPATLKWSVPLTYTSGAVGIIVLLFKVVVIIPVIGAFTWYATREKESLPGRSSQPERPAAPELA